MKNIKVFIWLKTLKAMQEKSTSENEKAIAGVIRHRIAVNYLKNKKRQSNS